MPKRKSAVVREAAVIHGGFNRDHAAFERKVQALQDAVSKADPVYRWHFTPIPWPPDGTDVIRIVASLPSAYPEKPPWQELAPKVDEDTIKIDNKTVIGVLTEDGTRAPITITMARAIWELRAGVLPKLAGVLSDALLYGHDHKAIRKDVTKKIKAVFGEGPATVIAHSGGGMIAVDLAAEGMLEIDGLVTFGSLSAFLHIVDPTRLRLDPFEPPTETKPAKRVPLKGINRWTNLYSAYDFAGFAASGVFNLASKEKIKDCKARLPGGTKLEDAHDAYWRSNDLVKAILETCK